MIYTALSKGPFKVPGYHDPDSTRLMGIILRPDVWTAATVYYLRAEDDYDIVIPAVFTGYYHKVKSPGKSGATEPVWATTVGGQTPDGTTGLIWEAVAYNLMPASETIATVVNTCTNSVTLSSESSTNTNFQYMINALPVAAETAGVFEITSHISKSNGEALDVTLKFKVGER